MALTIASLGRNAVWNCKRPFGRRTVVVQYDKVRSGWTSWLFLSSGVSFRIHVICPSLHHRATAIQHRTAVISRFNFVREAMCQRMFC